MALGQYGPSKDNLPRVAKKLPESKDLYVLGSFSWEGVVESKSLGLPFRGACNDVAGCRGYDWLPTDPQHLLDALGRLSMRDVIYHGAAEIPTAIQYCPPDQYSVDLAGYNSKLKFGSDKSYVYMSECWLQAGDRESAIHVDNGRVVSYIG